MVMTTSTITKSRGEQWDLQGYGSIRQGWLMPICSRHPWTDELPAPQSGKQILPCDQKVLCTFRMSSDDCLCSALWNVKRGPCPMVHAVSPHLMVQRKEQPEIIHRGGTGNKEVARWACGWHRTTSQGFNSLIPLSEISVRTLKSGRAWADICLWTLTRRRRRRESPAGRCLATRRTQQGPFTKSGSQQAGCRILGISQPTARTSCIQPELDSLQAKLGENVSQLSFFHLHQISSKSQTGSQQSSPGSLTSADLNPSC